MNANTKEWLEVFEYWRKRTAIARAKFNAAYTAAREEYDAACNELKKEITDDTGSKEFHW